MRERSAVIQDELVNRNSQRMERTMYILTVVATIMLPLGFLTGLLGINVGGIPGTDSPWAFWAVSGALAVVVVIEVLVMRNRMPFKNDARSLVRTSPIMKGVSNKRASSSQRLIRRSRESVLSRVNA